MMATTELVFTVDDVARMLKVARRTVTKWFDSGRLKGEWHPRTHARQIPRSELIAFFKDHGLPVDAIPGAD